jgi:hypothetical protein
MELKVVQFTTNIPNVLNSSQFFLDFIIKNIKRALYTTVVA